MKLLIRENLVRSVDYYGLDLNAPVASVWIATCGNGNVYAFSVKPVADFDVPANVWEWKAHVEEKRQIKLAHIDLEGTHPRDTLRRYPVPE